MAGVEQTGTATTPEAAADCGAGLGHISTAAVQQAAAPHPMCGGLLWAAGLPNGSQPPLQHGTASGPAASGGGAFCSASAAAELAEAFCGDGPSTTSNELEAAADAAYAEITEGLCLALIGPPPAMLAGHNNGTNDVL